MKYGQAVWGAGVEFVLEDLFRVVEIPLDTKLSRVHKMFVPKWGGKPETDDINHHTLK